MLLLFNPDPRTFDATVTVPLKGAAAVVYGIGIPVGDKQHG